MSFFAVKGYSAIKKFNDSNTNSSSLSKALQSQLFNSLVIQTAIPVILIHVPSTMILICSFRNTTEEVYGHVFTVAVSLFPVIDPLPSMIIIQPYRRAIKSEKSCILSVRNLDIVSACFRPEASTQNSSVIRVNPKSSNITSRVVTF